MLAINDSSLSTAFTGVQGTNDSLPDARSTSTYLAPCFRRPSFDQWGMGDVEASGSFVGNVRSSAAPLLFETGLFGAHTLLMFISVYILAGKGLSVTRRTVLLALILAIYACSTTHWAIALATFYRLIGHPGEASDYSPAGTIVSVVAAGINITLSDAIVLWRAHVVWGRSRVVVFVSLFCLLMTPALLLTNVGILIESTVSHHSLSTMAGDTIIGGLGILSSCITNIWATSLVILRTVKYRREFMKYLRNYRRGRSEKVLMLLVESGVLYSVFWVILLAIAWIGICNSQADDRLSGLIEAQSTIIAGMAQLCGVYPTVVIVAVCLQGIAYDPHRLTGQVPGLDPEDDGHISTELEFGPRCRTQGTTRTRSVELQLPVLSSDPSSERDEDKKSVESVS